MKKKILLSLTTAAFLALSLTACGTAGSQTPGTQSSQSTATGTTVTQSSVNSTSGQNTASAVVTPDVPATNSETQTTGTSEITEEQAKQIAFEHAQVQESDLVNLKVKKDYDDGISVYEVDFQYGNKEYEYDIKADDGQILKTDFEIDEDYVDPSTQTAVSEADAKASALSRVEGASDSDVRIQLKKDDGRLIYEGAIIHNNVEYEFEIDADTGDFLKWEQDSVFD